MTEVLRESRAILAAKAIENLWLDVWANVKMHGEQHLEQTREQLTSGFSAILTLNDRSMAGDIALIQRTQRYLGSALAHLDVIVAQKFSSGRELGVYGEILSKIAQRMNFSVHPIVQGKELIKIRDKQLLELAKDTINQTYAQVRASLSQQGNVVFVAFEGSRARDLSLQPATTNWEHIFANPDLLDQTIILPTGNEGAEKIHDAKNTFHLKPLLFRSPVHLTYGKPFVARAAVNLAQIHHIRPEDVVMCAIAATLSSEANLGFYAKEQFSELIDYFRRENIYTEMLNDVR